MVVPSKSDVRHILAGKHVAIHSRQPVRTCTASTQDPIAADSFVGNRLRFVRGERRKPFGEDVAEASVRVLLYDASKRAVLRARAAAPVGDRIAE